MITILLIPGFMLDSDLWRDVRDSLERIGPVLDVDTTRDPTIDSIAERALAGTRGPIMPVGFSMGGYVAREIARRGSGRVRGLVLLATSARGDTPEKMQRRALYSDLPPGTAFAGLSRSAISRSLSPMRANDSVLIERIQAMGRRLGPDVFRRQSLLSRNGDLDHLDKINCPTLILAGECDRVRTVSESEELWRNIPGSEMAVIEKAGHMLPFETPDHVANTILSWSEAKKITP